MNQLYSSTDTVGNGKCAIRTRDLDLWYGTFQALEKINR